MNFCRVSLQFFDALIISVIILVTSSTLLYAESYSRKEVLADIDQIVAKLKRFHPNLYAHRNSKEFRKIVNAIKGKTKENSSRVEAAIQFQRVLSAVFDEHTGVRFDIKTEPRVFENTRFLDDTFLLDKERVLHTNKIDYMDKKFAQFGDEKSAKVLHNFLRQMQPNDGCIREQNYLIDTRHPFSMIALSTLYSPLQEYVKVAIGNNPIASKTLLMRTVRINELGKFIREQNINAFRQLNSKLVKLKFDFWVSESFFEKRLIVYHNKQYNIFYVRIGTFLVGKKWTKTLNKVMRKIIKSKPKHIIIDLIGNRGGSLEKAGRFASYYLPRAHRPAEFVRAKYPFSKHIKTLVWHSPKSKKDHRQIVRPFTKVRLRAGQRKVPYRRSSFGNPDYKGKISVLVGPGTHSAAVFVAWILKIQRGAKLYGFTNGPNLITGCYAPGGSHKLNNTNIQINIPFVCYDRNRSNAKSNVNLIPDVVVNPMHGPANSFAPRALEAAFYDIFRN